MEFWTLLVIVALGGPLDGQEQGLAYRSEAECLAALQVVPATLGYDNKTACEVTALPSGSIRPKRNPIYGDQ